MADFCKQCAVRVFGKGTPSDFERPEWGETARFEVLCEGCGWTQVDRNGRCNAPWCPRHSDDAPVGED